MTEFNGVELTGIITGSDGTDDTVTYATATGAVNASLSNGGSDGAADGDSFTNIENLTGSNFADRLTGNTIANVISGLADDDAIDGGAGNDTIDGGTGNDTMIGGGGNDVYVITGNGNDVIDETTGQVGDIDTVQSSITFNLGDNNMFGAVENLTLTGHDNIDGTGNDLDNVLTGNDGEPLDRQFRTATGTLASAAFYAGAAAHDASDRIIYNSKTGALIYDANGSAAGGAVQFATLSAGLTLTNADFVVV